MGDWKELNQNQQKVAIESLLKTQELLGQLEFTLASDQTYYKDYGLQDGSIVRLQPVFDKGISMDMSHRLVGITVSSMNFVPMEEGMPVQLEKFPRECTEDVARIVSKLAPQARTPVKEAFVLTIVCSQCKEVVSSFVQVDGEQSCLNCAGLME